MKKLLYIIAGLILAAAAAFVAAGIIIPNEKTVTQVTEINASAETVWTVLNDREKYPEWQDQLEKVEVKDEKRWTEVTPGGPIEFVIDRSDEGRSMDISYSMGESFKGTWRGELSPRGDKQALLRTTDKTVVDGWFTKVMMAMFFDLEDFAREWNAKLKKRAEAIEEGGP